MHKGITKLLLAAFVAVLIVMPLSACNKNNSNAPTPAASSDAKKTVYTTFFPVYDLTKRIVGDKMDVKMIIKGNQEPHDFELQAADMASITKADLIVYNGAGMESFINDLKTSAKNDDKFLDLSQGLTLLQNKDAVTGDHSSVNPHTWLSIKNALVELDTLYKKVVAIDPQNADYYKQNFEKATAQFKELDKKFEETLSKVSQSEKYFVVSHAAFNYLAHDYGLKQVAVTGISPEDEPSAAQLATIADFVKQHKISTIFFEGKATPKVAETLAKNTGTKTATLYTMESLTEEEQQMGYLKLMEHNLNELVKSFSE
ncbi:MAG: zinc ABC transporter substrate-binding protein [Atopobium sp.]|uniref:metal ABC transporter solute-binding protein, Zn/Mn family n=1 Tax=Atopobium sp. TaxID=1872650 RepID=UPI002A766A3E|nr:zinc ABC transporter substrate-binding protein [Atopobium sp.]MDY2789001.1 zinc ABC transporter substrate-binding protein [Atopobium sp.]MDY4522029.1 zinc ABC transporter substrate-binding protein [Atopobium sp.]